MEDPNQRLYAIQEWISTQVIPNKRVLTQEDTGLKARGFAKAYFTNRRCITKKGKSALNKKKISRVS